MAEHREQDVTLTGEVRQFRRAARLAAADPLRLLPPDPLVRLAALDAPLAALIDVGIFEPLRAALSSLARDARPAAVRARVQPLARSGSGARPHARPAPGVRTGRAATAGDRGTHALPRSPAQPRTGDAQLQAERARSGTGSTATLAERRRALRRQLQHPGAHAPLGAASGPATMPAAGPESAVQQLTGGEPSTAPHVTRATPAPPARPRRLLPDGPRLVSSGVAPFADTHASAREETVIGEAVIGDAVDGRTDDSPGLAEGAVAPGRAGDPGGGSEMDTVHRGWPPATTADHAFTPRVPRAHGGADPRQGPLARVSEPAADDPAGHRRPRPWDRHAGLDFGEDLFELLYREGVDLSWP